MNQCANFQLNEMYTELNKKCKQLTSSSDRYSMLSLSGAHSSRKSQVHHRHYKDSQIARDVNRMYVFYSSDVIMIVLKEAFP